MLAHKTAAHRDRDTSLVAFGLIHRGGKHSGEQDTNKEVILPELLGQHELVLELSELVDVGEALADGQVKGDIVFVVTNGLDKVKFQLEKVPVVNTHLENVQIGIDKREKKLLVKDVERFFDE